jgi:hypothetical protein
MCPDPFKGFVLEVPVVHTLWLALVVSIFFLVERRERLLFLLRPSRGEGII